MTNTPRERSAVLIGGVHHGKQLAVSESMHLLCMPVRDEGEPNVFKTATYERRKWVGPVENGTRPMYASWVLSTLTDEQAWSLLQVAGVARPATRLGA